MNPVAVLKVILKFIVFTIIVNIVIWISLIVSAHVNVSEAARMLAYPVSEEGCLPSGVRNGVTDEFGGEIVEFKVNQRNGGTETTSGTLNLYKDYIETFNNNMNSRDNFLKLFLTYDNRSVEVLTEDDSGEFTQDAYTYTSAARRGEKIKVRVTGRLRLPMFFYVGWQLPDIQPALNIGVSKELVLYSYKYQSDQAGG